MNDKEKISALSDAIKTLHQTILEVKGAQNRGNEWYTNGHSGLYAMVAYHLNEADMAIKSVENIVYTCDISNS